MKRWTSLTVAEVGQLRTALIFLGFISMVAMSDDKPKKLSLGNMKFTLLWFYVEMIVS